MFTVKIKGYWRDLAKQDYKYLKDAPKVLLADAEFMASLARSTGGMALCFASEEIRPKLWGAFIGADDDFTAKFKAFWLKKATRYFRHLQYAPRELLDDADFMVAAAAATDGWALYYASEEKLMADVNFRRAAQQALADHCPDSMALANLASYLLLVCARANSHSSWS